jgi:hypothetical protein
MTDEELLVLVLRAVTAGADEDLRIRDLLLRDEGVDRGQDRVVAAVHDECWCLTDSPNGISESALHRARAQGRLSRSRRRSPLSAPRSPR